MIEINSVAPPRALEWYKGGWNVFMANMPIWALMALIVGVVAYLLSWLPFLGAAVLFLLIPVAQGGLLLAAQKVREGRSIDLQDLLAIFQDPAQRIPLIVLGAYMLGASVISSIVVGGTLLSGTPDPSGGMLVNFSSGGIVLGLILGILMAMLFLFAPALIVFRQLAPLDAIKTSFSACAKNPLTILLFLVIYAVLSFIAAIPFGLGFLVLLPVMMGATYQAYQELFA